MTFCRLRDATLLDATAYTFVVLPISSVVVNSISRYFDYYLAYEFEEWLAHLSDITKVLELCHRFAERSEEIHVDFLASFKNHEDKTMTCEYNLKDLIESLKARQEKMQVQVEQKAELTAFFSSLSVDYSWVSLGLVPALKAVCQQVEQNARAKEAAMKADLDEAQRALNITRVAFKGAVEVCIFYSNFILENKTFSCVPFGVKETVRLGPRLCRPESSNSG